MAKGKKKAVEESILSAEKLLVIALLGIVAIISIPLLSASGERAAISDMEDTLKAVSVAQDKFHAQRGYYASNVSELEEFGFVSMAGVTISMESWIKQFVATASSENTKEVCMLAKGTVVSMGSGPEVENEVVCLDKE